MADDEFDRLQLLVDWMRANGVVVLDLEDVKLRLDPAWRPAVAETYTAEPKTSDEKLQEIAAIRSAVDQRPFRHVRR